jgi:small-conductance mechanosensitive channel
MEDDTIEQLTEQARTIFEVVYNYLDTPEVLFQIGIIIAAVVPAWFVAGFVEKKIENAVRRIRGMRVLLRIIVAFLRRIEWFFVALFLGIAYVATQLAGWPESTRLLYSAMLLSAAWLFISAVSRIIRNRVVAKLFAMLAWSYVAASLFGITDDIRAILEGARLPVLEISLWQIITGVAAVGVLLWVAQKLGNILDDRIQQTEELTPSLRVLLGKITRISLMIFAVLFGMQLLNINLTALTVLSGAVGVGIGFGLQKVVSNFISGVIILLDQSIKPGDTITLGETFGWIRELRARFVSVVTRDGREYLIPNEDFITTQVVNWSFSDKFVRLDVPFGVSYNSDPHEVIRLAKEAAGSCEARRRRTPPAGLLDDRVRRQLDQFPAAVLDRRSAAWLDQYPRHRAAGALGYLQGTRHQHSVPAPRSHHAHPGDRRVESRRSGRRPHARPARRAETFRRLSRQRLCGPCIGSR